MRWQTLDLKPSGIEPILLTLEIGIQQCSNTDDLTLNRIVGRLAFLELARALQRPR